MQEKNVPTVTPVPTSWTGICLQYLHPKKHFLQCSTQICNSYKYQKKSIEATKFGTTPHSDVVLPNPQYLYDNAKCSWMEFALLRLSGVAGQVLPLGTTWQVQQSIHRCCQDAIGEATQNQEESDLAREELWMKVVNYDFSRVLLPCDDLIWSGDICLYHGNVLVKLHSLHGCRLNVVNIGAFIHQKHLRLGISQNGTTRSVPISEPFCRM